MSTAPPRTVGALSLLIRRASKSRNRRSEWIRFRFTAKIVQWLSRVISVRFPFPVGELLAEGHFFEFADGGSGDSFNENERIRDLPLGERFCEKGPQLLCRSVKTFLQQHSGQWPLMPFRMGNADDASFFDGGMTH